MENNKESKMSKYFLYTLLCVCIFAVVLLSASFIAGNTNVFEWDSFNRFFIVLLTLTLSAGVIGYKETM
mgnify:CR=1 FL=1|tara:strand:+ start:575 stop:781 length:207 start_codon:yes stop_codon:yes gene_type:complete